jgi:hypothetical protein
MGYPFFGNGGRCGFHRLQAGNSAVQIRRILTPTASISKLWRPHPAGAPANIFEEYTSYAGGQDRSGGGLGLAICKMIATLHGGRVWAENTETGPMFSFVLPVFLAEPGVPEAAQAQLLNYTEA